MYGYGYPMRNMPPPPPMEYMRPPPHMGFHIPPPPPPPPFMYGGCMGGRHGFEFTMPPPPPPPPQMDYMRSGHWLQRFYEDELMRLKYRNAKLEDLERKIRRERLIAKFRHKRLADEICISKRDKPCFHHSFPVNEMPSYKEYFPYDERRFEDFKPTNLCDMRPPPICDEKVVFPKITKEEETKKNEGIEEYKIVFIKPIKGSKEISTLDTIESIVNDKKYDDQKVIFILQEDEKNNEKEFENKDEEDYDEEEYEEEEEEENEEEKESEEEQENEEKCECSEECECKKAEKTEEKCKKNKRIPIE